MPSSLLQKVNNLKQKYPSFDDFCLVYSPYRQDEFAIDERKTIMEDYSSISILDLAYAPGCTASWVGFTLAELNSFSGTKNIDDKQTKSLARLIAREYKDMKISIFQLFFFRFKCGDFGKFYGKVDPMAITCALKDYMNDCEMKRQKFLNEEYEERRAEEERIRQANRMRWEKCQNELCTGCPDDHGKKAFAALEIYSYTETETERLLTLNTDREDYELIEGKYIQLFSTVLRCHYPNVKIQYRLRPSPVQQSAENNNNKPSLGKKVADVQATIESAKRIINNELGLDTDTLENMRYSFKLRYKCWPEEYLKRHEAYCK